MKANPPPAGILETKVLISLLWIMVALNMLTADVLSLYIPGAAEELNAFAGATPIPTLMLVGAFVFETPIAMVALSRHLKRRPSRWINILAAVITILFVVGGGAPFPHYIFMAAVEVLCMLVIVWKVWTWPAAEQQTRGRGP